LRSQAEKDTYTPAGPRALVADRQPPCNLDAERAILGACFLDKEAVGMGREVIAEEHFYRREHRLIFGAMCSLYEENQAIDAITVSEALERDGHLVATGGIDYLTDLAASVATAANVTYHAKIVKEKAVLRDLITASTAISAEAFEGGDEASEILDRAQSRIYQISEDTRRGGFEPVELVVDRTFKTIEEACQNQSDVTGLRTGFVEMDRRLSGLQRSDLIIVAARPAMGKTSLALNMAYNVAVREQQGVAIFSLEMAKEQLVMRMLCSSTGFNLLNVRRGKLRPEDWPRLTGACEKL